MQGFDTNRIEERTTEEKAKERYSRYECLQPNDVADAVTMALAAPRRVDVSDILIRSTYDAGV